MTQQATVEKLLPGGRAMISVRRKAACAAECATCGGCAHPEETMTAEALNLCDARPGDAVTVESETGRVMGLAALLYVMPVALLVAGYFVVPGGEGVRIVGALLGLAAGLAVCFGVSRHMRRTGANAFRLVAVTGRFEAPDAGGQGV
jgi:sigma-E factor negative regulatory protein RseC